MELFSRPSMSDIINEDFVLELFGLLFDTLCVYESGEYVDELLFEKGDEDELDDNDDDDEFLNFCLPTKLDFKLLLKSLLTSFGSLTIFELFELSARIDEGSKSENFLLFVAVVIFPIGEKLMPVDEIDE